MQDDPEDVLTTGWVGTWDLRKGRESMRETTQMNEPGSNFWYFFFHCCTIFHCYEMRTKGDPEHGPRCLRAGAVLAHP